LGWSKVGSSTPDPISSTKPVRTDTPSRAADYSLHRLSGRPCRVAAISAYNVNAVWRLPFPCNDSASAGRRSVMEQARTDLVRDCYPARPG